MDVELNAEQLNVEAVPPGCVPLKVILSEQSDLFDYGEIQRNPNLHLWAIRAPFNITAKHLKDLSLTLPPNANEKPITLARFNRKDKSYSVLSVPSGSASNSAGELNSLSCLLPHSEKHGEFKLVMAPKPIEQRILITLADVNPTPPEQLTDYFKTPTPRTQPPQSRLSHVFAPIGSLALPQDQEETKHARDIPITPTKRSPNHPPPSASSHAMSISTPTPQKNRDVRQLRIAEPDDSNKKRKSNEEDSNTFREKTPTNIQSNAHRQSTSIVKRRRKDSDINRARKTSASES